MRRSAEAQSWLADLAAGVSIARPVAVVVAHPDDETLGLGARLARLERLHLIHLTDGAPAAPDDARRAGFPSREAYALARARELDRALAVLGVSARRENLGVRDQEAVLRLPALVRELVPRLAGCDAVITHAYEGGHPDHDAASFAVQAACAALGPRAPLRLEFASYHQAEGVRVTGAFWSDAEHPAALARIAPADLARKQAALACHASQAEVLAWFDPAREAYRAAPVYDFTAPPPPGSSLYDGFGWTLTSAAWCAKAAAALDGLTETVT